MPECPLEVGVTWMNATRRTRWVTAVTTAMATCTVTRAVTKTTTAARADQRRRTCMRKTLQVGSDHGRTGRVEGGEEGGGKTVAEAAASARRETVSKGVGAMFTMAQQVPLILAGGACVEGEGGVAEGGEGEGRGGEGVGEIRPPSWANNQTEIAENVDRVWRLDKEKGVAVSRLMREKWMGILCMASL